MVVKFNTVQFNFLAKQLRVERPDLFKYFENNDGLMFVLNDDIANEVRDWAGEKLQKEGFDINYKLTDTGKILEQLEDLLYE